MNASQVFYVTPGNIIKDEIWLLTRCFIQHFLGPYIDSEVNHERHLFKILFINKGMLFIDLHSIVNNQSAIPLFLTETPIISYKHN